MIGLLAGPLLACGYFLNGGIGQLMQPNANHSGGSGPTANLITTQAGANITTQAGTALKTDSP